MTGKTRSRMAGSMVCRASLIVVMLGWMGCVAPPRLPVHAVRHRLDLDIRPDTHRLYGRSTIDLVGPRDFVPGRDGRVAVEFNLHPKLRVVDVQAAGAEILRHYARWRRKPKSDPLAPRTHIVVLDRPTDALTLFVDYEGELFQDVSAGEVAGQIHNFEMKAHVSPEGIYLGGGYWYPEPVHGDEDPPVLLDFTVLVTPVDGIELVAAAERDPLLSKETGKLAWRTPYPVDGMVIVGGPHQVYHDRHNQVDIALHLKPSQSTQVQGLFDTVKRNLDRYEPLIGRYPAREFAIVDNFFSSGFAFPTFTLLSSAVIDMGERSQTSHGYIDHEVLHCWWGNGIHVDPSDGNWCEALASYGANYYGHILDGHEDEARRKRRNYSHFLSRIKPENDKPLGTYGQEDGCGRGIAYNKGAAVFHMLARKMGQETFWSAMRRFTAEYVGRYASWDDIQRVCEKESGQSLDTFFQQWVRRGGAPAISVESAKYHTGDGTLTLTLRQEGVPFTLDLPIRMTYAGGTQDVVVALAKEVQEVSIHLNVTPMTVEIDPDYHVFRKVPLDELLPTTASTRYGSAFATVLPAGEVADTYRSLQSIFESSFEDDERTELVAGAIEEGALAESCVLILGEAVRDPYVAAFLSAVEFPVRWDDEGFAIGEDHYNDPEDALVVTAAHPGVPGGGITVFYGNSEEALPAAMLVPFYEHSLIVFKNRKATERRDLERRHPIPVEIS